MGLREHNSYEEQEYTNFDKEEYNDEIKAHKRHVRRLLNDRLERKLLKMELEDYEGELDQDFDWSNFS